ncbi:barstar family protein [Streptomyces sp. ISL-94]|uniref:barstar family protein n=1 Tax=Streptomyces sp. ISL-94 TaxID=2819190 RepID=UPI001BEABA34|nr:barstar family protein [Streptomyces sp. ISL-94]MBT2482719.1 barstar family protein [Streptomyces sp. ISL-94]
MTTLDPQPLAPALAAAEEAGWTTVRLDLDGVRSKAELMRRCGDALLLPEWFGGNWDALADCLIDLSWLPDAAGRLVAVTSWRGFAAVRPTDWEVLREILEQAVDFWRERSGGPALTVLLADGPAGAASGRGPRL